MVRDFFSNITRKLGLIRPWAYKLAHNPVAGAGLWAALFCFSGDATLFIRFPLWRKAVFCFRPAQPKTTCSYMGVKVRPSWTQRLHWAVLLTQLLHPPTRARYLYLELIKYDSWRGPPWYSLVLRFKVTSWGNVSHWDWPGLLWAQR